MQISSTRGNMKEFEEFLHAHANYRHLMLNILQTCKEKTTFDKINSAISAYPAIETFTMSPIEVLSVMKDFQLLMEEFDETDKIEYWQTTPEGLKIIEKFDPAKASMELINDTPKLAAVYYDVLISCKNGKKLSDLETEFIDNKTLAEEKLFVNSCIHELERTGALRWQDNCWQTTEEGLKLI